MSWPSGTRVVKVRPCASRFDRIPVGTEGIVVDMMHNRPCRVNECMFVDIGDGGIPWHTEVAAWKKVEDRGSWDEIEKSLEWNPTKEKVCST